jgi:hypothetical protein
LGQVVVLDMAEHSHGDSDQRLAVYRKKAVECRQESEKSLNSPDDKEAWLRLAEDWTKMAQEIGRQLRRE